MSVFYRGSEEEILQVLRELQDRDGHSGDTTRRLAQAADLIKGGERFLIAASWRFEVVESLAGIEQDVYGCEAGAGCPDVAPELRTRFEAMIAQRREALQDRPRDDRTFHWFRRFRSPHDQPADVSGFVGGTLGWDLVASVGEAIAGAFMSAQRATGEFDVHLTMLPELVRLRFDAESAGHPDWPEAGDENLALGAEHATSCWTVVEDRSWTLLAEFARHPGDAKTLVPNHRPVRGDQIGFGAYIYVPSRDAWMQFDDRRVSGGYVEFDPAEEFTGPVRYLADKDVAVFWDGIGR